MYNSSHHCVHSLLYYVWKASEVTSGCIAELEKPSSRTARQYGEQIQESLQEAYTLARKAIEASARRMKAKYDVNVRGANPQEGDVVLK